MTRIEKEIETLREEWDQRIKRNDKGFASRDEFFFASGVLFARQLAGEWAEIKDDVGTLSTVAEYIDEGVERDA